uniref:PPM-type phosphatase domain-containing protein n=1 Tax=Eucampia antarctica TaxID=49252 RepID=A0A7S2S3X0_9STRA
MKPANSITLFFAAAAFTAMSLPRLVEAETDARTSGQRSLSTSDDEKRKQPDDVSSSLTNCPSYGCPILPRDMYFDEEAQEALKAIRNLQVKIEQREEKSGGLEDTEVDNLGSLSLENALDRLKSAGGEDQATLTLIGYKGGKVEDQINQDRAFVISPFLIDQKTNTDTFPKARLMGVFDGHAKLGEFVSQYSVSELPKLLSEKIHSLPLDQIENDEKAVKQILIDSFVQMDKAAPAELSGGCTASVVLQLGRKIYIANAGDSRSLVATFQKSTGRVNIVYLSREDKPDLPDEKARVENMGGQVYIPQRVGASSRVIYVDSYTGVQSGLAMSRSIGDWDAGNVGVIPNPIVEVLNIETLKNIQTEEDSCVAQIDARTGETTMDINCITNGEEKKDDNSLEDDVEVFAVSATDGMLDFVNVEDIARNVAASLYLDEGPHPLSACEGLISTAAAGWWKSKDGKYRDDIAIAISKFDS